MKSVITTVRRAQAVANILRASANRDVMQGNTILLYLLFSTSFCVVPVCQGLGSSNIDTFHFASKNKHFAGLDRTIYFHSASQSEKQNKHQTDL